MLLCSTKSTFFTSVFLIINLILATCSARDLAEIKSEGVLRHIGVPYANFITLYQDSDHVIEGGLDVELMKGFANSLGLKYQFIPATWSNAFTLLTGQSALYADNTLIRGAITHEIQGDVIANGATILPWREEVVDFSVSYFPSAVWLVARSDSKLMPIKPTGSVNKDIEHVKSLMTGIEVLAMKQTCLDPDLYDLNASNANIIFPTTKLKLNEMVPAILNNEAETTLLDVADTLIALQKWPGEIKVIGPVSQDQTMGVAFRKNSPELRTAFNQYFQRIKSNGEYNRLVERYYPSVFNFYGDFFENDHK